MIAHRITYAQLAAKITAVEPDWFTDAAAIIASLPAAPKNKNFDAIWTDINFFPISGVRDTGAADPTQLAPENAYLIYPIGDFDVDPEDLITFDGLSPKPAVAAGFDMQRACVTIELFRLDSVTKRPFLYKARAKLLRLLYLELRGLEVAATQAERDEHNRAIAALTGDLCPFANCMRAFERLFGTDRAKAAQYASECVKYLESKDLGEH